MNVLNIVKVDRIRDPLQGKKDHAKMYVLTLVRTALGPGGKASITMVLPDSGNLLTRATNKQSLEIQGVSKGIYIRFPNVSKTSFVKPLDCQESILQA